MPLELSVLTVFSSHITTEAEIHKPTEQNWKGPVAQPVRERVLHLAIFLWCAVTRISATPK